MQRTSKAMFVFPRIGWNLRISNDHPLGKLYPPENLDRYPICVFLCDFSYQIKYFCVFFISNSFCKFSSHSQDRWVSKFENDGILPSVFALYSFGQDVNRLRGAANLGPWNFDPPFFPAFWASRFYFSFQSSWKMREETKQGWKTTHFDTCCDHARDSCQSRKIAGTFDPRVAQNIGQQLWDVRKICNAWVRRLKACVAVKDRSFE